MLAVGGAYSCTNLDTPKSCTTDPSKKLVTIIINDNPVKVILFNSCRQDAIHVHNYGESSPGLTKDMTLDYNCTAYQPSLINDFSMIIAATAVQQL